MLVQTVCFIRVFEQPMQVNRFYNISECNQGPFSSDETLVYLKYKSMAVLLPIFCELKIIISNKGCYPAFFNQLFNLQSVGEFTAKGVTTFLLDVSKQNIKVS